MTLQEIQKRTVQFQANRFGMFIHFGLYTSASFDPWLKSMKEMSDEQYQMYFDAFNPGQFDARAICRLAKQAGMKYVVMTTKHHEGFCLFDSKYTEYNSVHAPCKRDLVREFVDACREEGLMVGLYYSLIDWHHPDFFMYGDAIHPRRNDSTAKDLDQDFDRYRQYMFNQIRELCTNYGKIDIMWFDFTYGDKTSDTWNAAELVKMVRSYQPDVIIDNRLETSGGGMGSIITEHPNDFCGDFVSPEMVIPPYGVRNYAGEPVPWECCATINNNWGYCIQDKEYKTAKTLIRKLVECVSKGGNLLLDVGPDPKGRIDPPSTKVLTEIGKWMQDNSASIYGCGRSEYPKPEWGRYTQRGNVVYAHVLEQQMGPIALTGIPKEKIRYVKYLGSNIFLQQADTWVVGSYKDTYFVTLGDVPHFTYELYDEIDTVLEITLNE